MNAKAGFWLCSIAAVCFSILPAVAQIPFSEERDIALWVLRLGGQVMVDGADTPISDPFDLPSRDFRIVMVDMHGTMAEPKDLERLKKLTEVRELHIPARVWSPVSDVKAPLADESFEYYQGMKKLESFQAGLTTLAWLDIGDEGVKRLAPLTQLKSLRVANTTIKDPKCFEALVNLEYLDLDDAYVLDSSLAPLAKMKKLRRLDAHGNAGYGRGTQVSARLDRPGRTEPLRSEGDGYRPPIPEQAHQAAESQSAGRPDHRCQRRYTLAKFTELRELILYRSKISDAGLAKLRQLKNLETLDLRYSGVSPSGVEAFRTPCPTAR